MINKQKSVRIISTILALAICVMTPANVYAAEAASSYKEHQEVAASDNMNIVDLGIQDIVKEIKCNRILESMKDKLDSKEYFETMKLLIKIDKSYSKYSMAQDLYNESKVSLIDALGEPTTIEEYEEAINELDKYIRMVADNDFIRIQNIFKESLTSYRKIHQVIADATVLYENHAYKQAFEKLEAGLKQYPDNEKIEYVLSSYQYAFIMDNLEQAVELAEQEDYKAIVQLMENALEEYDCQQFHDMLHEAKMKSDFLYALKEKSIEAADYIFSSGKKLIGGDFNQEDEETILSLGGSIAASIANVDAPLDARDLAYDMVHWGEGDYFAARLAIDAVSLLPLLGAIKYVDSVSDIAKKIDDVTDAAKKTDAFKDAINAVDKLFDVVKPTDKVIDTADIITDVKKRMEVVTDAANNNKVVKTIKKNINRLLPEKKLDTINAKLLNKAHPDTGIIFKEHKVELPDGRRISGVFPEFKSEFSSKIPEDMFTKSSKQQMAECNKQLYETIQKDSKMKAKFTEDQIKQIESGMTTGAAPDGYVWHHEPEPGKLSLVDAEVHSKTAHSGGNSLWGNAAK